LRLALQGFFILADGDIVTACFAVASDPDAQSLPHPLTFNPNKVE
jgi:hypothetical protein